MKKTVIFIWKSPYPWEVRIEKICNTLSEFYNVVILARWGGEDLEEETIQNGIIVRRVGFERSPRYSIPTSLNPNWRKAIEKTIIDFDAKLLIVKEIMLANITGKLAIKHKIGAILSMAENYPALIKLFKKYKKDFIRRFFFHQLEIAKNVEKKVLGLIKNVLVVVPEQIERLKDQGFFQGFNYEIAENSPLFIEDTNLKKTENKLIFGHHGFMTGDKNVFKFLNALIELLKEGIDLEFHILGDGEVFEDTKKIIDESGFQDKLILYGKWNDKMYEDYLDKISYGVLPYDINDFTNTTNFNKFYDFLQVGIPIIASDTKPMRRIIEDQNCGILIDIDDRESIKNSIRELSNVNYQQLAENSYKAYKEKHNWQCEEERLLNFVKKVIVE